MKRFRIVQTCFLVFLMFLCLSVPASAEELSDLRKDREETENKINQAKDDIEELEETTNQIEKYIQELDETLNSLMEELTELKASLEEKREELGVVQEELAEAQAVEEKQYQDMKKRIQYMYEQGENTYLVILMSAQNLSDLLNKAEYITRISEYDRNMLVKYQEVKELVAEKEEQVRLEYEKVDVAKKQVEKKQEEVNDLIEVKSEELKAFAEELENTQAKLEAFEADYEKQTEEIEALERAAVLEALGYSGGNGSMIWPASGGVSSRFGYRTHPVYGDQRFHNGIDIAASMGAPIYAAADGVVTEAGYSSSMGNYVMINHGDGLFTIYMHASALAASKGQHVSQGDLIAYVGSTGVSTGAHLHFSVRLNGSYVDPLNFLG